jgi:hypothetical protein
MAPALPRRRSLLASREAIIAAIALAATALHLILRFAVEPAGSFFGLPWPSLPLYAALLLSGAPLVLELVRRLARLDFSSDLLAGISIVTAVLLGEPLAGTLVVLML